MPTSLNDQKEILYILLNAKFLLCSEVAYIYLNVRNFGMVAKDWWIEFSKSNVFVRSLRVLIQMNHFISSRIYWEKMKKKNLIACALTETEDHTNSFQVEVHSMSSENLWKPLVFDIFRWLNRNRTLAWNGLTVNLKVLTSRIQKQSSFQHLQRPESRFQSPGSRVQRPTLASRVQELRYAEFFMYLYIYFLKKHNKILFINLL